MKCHTLKIILSFLFFSAQFQLYSQCQIDVNLYFDDSPTNGELEVGVEDPATATEIQTVYLVEVGPGYNPADPTITTTELVTLTLSEGIYQTGVAGVDCDKNYVVLVEEQPTTSFILANSGTFDYTPTTGDNDNDFIGRRDFAFEPFPGGSFPVANNLSVSGLITFPLGTTEVTVFGGGNDNGVLPVELMSFTGKNTKDCSTTLEWTTATESENAGFHIERSSDGRNYDEIAWIEGAGNSSETLSYSFIDKNPAKENYYRLKQVDHDGTYEYSKVVSINTAACGTHTNEITLFPSPTKNFVNLTSTLGFKGKTTISIVDYSGKVHLSQIINNMDVRTTGKIDLSDLTSGLYLLNIVDESNQVYPTQKIVKY